MNSEFYIKQLIVGGYSKHTNLVAQSGAYIFLDVLSVADIVLAKLDVKHNLLFLKSFLIDDAQVGSVSELLVCSNGDYLVTGKYTSQSDGLTKAFLGRLDSSGGLRWFKIISSVDAYASYSQILDLKNGQYAILNSREILKVDENGNLLKSYRSIYSSVILSKIIYFYQSIFLIYTQSSSTIGIAKLDTNLDIDNVVNYAFTNSPPGNLVLDAIVNDNNLIVTSRVPGGSYPQYLFSIDISQPLPSSLTCKTYNELEGYATTKVIKSFDGFYRFATDTSTDPYSTIIRKFGFNLGAISSKRIDKVYTYIDNIAIIGNKILFSGSDVGHSSGILYNGFLNDNLSHTENNCITVEDWANPVLNNLTIGTDSALYLELNPSNNQINPKECVVSDITETGSITAFCKINNVNQSPHLYFQAAGSIGADGTTEGMHLRWLLKRDLINHLPKGNLASNTVNFNKPDDFVILYRAPYTSAKITIDFSQPPKAIENRSALWIYKINGQTFFLYFKNKTQYDTVRNSFDPLTQSSQFIENYGNEILELQTSSDLFYAVELSVSSTASQSKVETEILSVEGSGIGEQQVTVRKTFTGTNLTDARIVMENGESFRFRPSNCQVTSIDIELYSVLADTIENGTGWTELGQFALSETDSEVYDRLEPTPGLVNAAWPRYNNGAFVNVQNYKDKWSNPNPSGTSSSIKQTVQDYIALSDVEDNPTAKETFSFDDILPEGATAEENTFELSNLTLLQQASMDYHVARMLGLGHLDIDNKVQNSNSFVYMAVYTTRVSRIDGQFMEEETEHRYITPPTSRTAERLPVPIDLKEPVQGVFLTNAIGEDNEPLTDEEGYTLDGKSRFITLYAEEPIELSQDKGFYSSGTEFNLASETFPVFAGIEYKKTGQTDWRKPELPNTPDFQNIASNGQTAGNETVPLPVPERGKPLFVHRETENGEHVYGSYSINWFSRISRSSQEHLLTTNIEPANTLSPPSDRSALLVTEEKPLLLTTGNEQQLLSSITGTDKTLIRLVFNYNSEQELQSYRVTEQTLNGATDALDADAIFPDSQEIFADEIEIYFRDSMPLNVAGKASGVTDDPSNELLSKITVGPYNVDSTDETIIPTVPAGKRDDFIGGVLVLEEKEYVIQAVSEEGGNLIFTVYKQQVSDKLQKGSEPNTSEELSSPEIKADGKFLAVENLQNTGSWGTPNPHPLKVQVGDNWPVHREVIERKDPDGNTEQYLQKTRGIWDEALIERVTQAETVSYNEETKETEVLTSVHKGQYKATFENAVLAAHPQNNGDNPVEWYKGTMRVHTPGNPNGERKTLEVFKIENIGSGNALVVFFTDINFSSGSGYDEIETGSGIQVNFYPGYRIYLYADSAAGITDNEILPDLGESIKYTCFGFRSVNNAKSYFSRIAVPTVMFAQEVIEPLVPQLPIGALYATRPDSFGKATYTLTTQFNHKPHGVLYYRTDDNAILNALYTTSTIAAIKEALAGSDSTFLANRWQNLLGFDYEYPSNSYQQNGEFGIYPETEDGYRLPNPNLPSLFNTSEGEVPGTIEPGNMINKIKEAVFQSFVPMTEIPLLYEHISSDPKYQPIAKKQTVRSRNGSVLSPTDPDFDMAPMAKVVGTNKVQFTDFTLDGTSDNLYFYATKELSARMQMGLFSPILGPIKLVNTNPPKQPAIRQVVPILENGILGIQPQMEVAVNAYPKVGNIKKIVLYRTLDPTDALSIRTMQLAKEINLETVEALNDNVWKIMDEFDDLPEVPFGDPLYYRVIVSREIEYPDKDNDNVILTEYVPSESSKLIVTTIVDSINPVAPQLTYTADIVNGTNELNNVVLSWEKTAYNATYFLYKLSEQGQWVKIHELESNESTISVPLGTTSLGTDSLTLTGDDGNEVFRHFKVSVKNTSDLLSLDDKILTVPTANS